MSLCSLGANLQYFGGLSEIGGFRHKMDICLPTLGRPKVAKVDILPFYGIWQFRVFCHLSEDAHGKIEGHDLRLFDMVNVLDLVSEVWLAAMGHLGDSCRNRYIRR